MSRIMSIQQTHLYTSYVIFFRTFGYYMQLETILL